MSRVSVGVGFYIWLIFSKHRRFVVFLFVDDRSLEGLTRQERRDDAGRDGDGRADAGHRRRGCSSRREGRGGGGAPRAGRGRVLSSPPPPRGQF